MMSIRSYFKENFAIALVFGGLGTMCTGAAIADSTSDAQTKKAIAVVAIGEVLAVAGLIGYAKNNLKNTAKYHND